MRSRLLFIALGLGFGLAFDATIALAWTGPTASAPNSNIGAPINVGTTPQTKNGDLGVNNISAFGNAMLSGLGVGTGRYINFDYTTGATGGDGGVAFNDAGSVGYGIRDNAGTLEFKNRNGTWGSLQSVISSYAGGQWTINGTSIYYNTGNVGVGVTNPGAKLDVAGAIVAGGSGANMDSAQALDDVVLPELLNTGKMAIGWNRTAGGGETDFIANKDGGSIGGFNFYDYSNAGVMNHLVTIQGSTGNMGVGTSTPGARLAVNGTALAAAFLYSSDARFKDHVEPLNYGLVQLMKLKPVSFTWNARSMQSGEQDIGLIAQQVEKVIPEVVHTDLYGMKSIDYVKLTPILIKAIQEQQKEVDALQARVAALENK